MKTTSVGNRHKQMRTKHLGLSVPEYAGLMKVKPVTVYSWENGRTAVPHSVMALLDSKYGVSVRWLLTGAGDMLTVTDEPSIQGQLERHIDEVYEALHEYQIRRNLRSSTPVVVGMPAKKKSGQGAAHAVVPMLSLAVSAGAPVASDDTIEREIDLASMLLEHPRDSYFLRVVGDSMSDAGIHDGDMLIVDCAVDPKPGHIVIARVYGELTVKRYLFIDAVPILRAENVRYRDIYITADMDFAIVGVVRSCIKQL